MYHLRGCDNKNSNSKGNKGSLCCVPVPINTDLGKTPHLQQVLVPDSMLMLLSSSTLTQSGFLPKRPVLTILTALCLFCATRCLVWRERKQLAQAGAVWELLTCSYIFRLGFKAHVFNCSNQKSLCPKIIHHSHYCRT